MKIIDTVTLIIIISIEIIALPLVTICELYNCFHKAVIMKLVRDKFWRFGDEHVAEFLIENMK